MTNEIKELEKFKKLFAKMLQSIPKSLQPELRRYIVEVHDKKISQKGKLELIVNKSFLMVHEQEKHNVDEFDYCKRCKLFMIDGVALQRLLPTKYKKEITGCVQCIEILKVGKEVGFTKEKIVNNWKKHFEVAHPELNEFNKLHKIDLTKIEIEIISKDGTRIGLDEVTDNTELVDFWKQYKEVDAKIGFDTVDDGLELVPIDPAKPKLTSPHLAKLNEKDSNEFAEYAWSKLSYKEKLNATKVYYKDKQAEKLANKKWENLPENTKRELSLLFRSEATRDKSKTPLEQLYEDKIPKEPLPDKRVPINYNRKKAFRNPNAGLPSHELYGNWNKYLRDKKGSIPSCNSKDCDGHTKAEFWFELMYRLAFRCEEHKDQVTSRIITRGKIDEKSNWLKAIGDVDSRFQIRASKNGVKDFEKFDSLTNDFNYNVTTWKPKEYEKWKKEVAKCIEQESFSLENLNQFDSVYFRINRYMTEKAKLMIPYSDKFSELTTEQNEELYYAFLDIMKKFKVAQDVNDEEKLQYFTQEITYDELEFLDKYGFEIQDKYFILNQLPARVDFYEQLMYYFADNNDRKIRVEVESQINNLIKVCPQCKKIVYNASISDDESKKLFDEHIKKAHPELAQNVDFENLSFGTFRDEIKQIVSNFLPINCGFQLYTTEQVEEVFKDFLTFWYYEKAPLVQNATLKNVILQKLKEFGTVIKYDLETSENADSIITYMIDKTSERAKKIDETTQKEPHDLTATVTGDVPTEIEDLDLTPISKLLEKLKPELKPEVLEDNINSEVVEPEPDPKIPVSTPPPEPPDKPKKITIYEFRRLAPTWNIKSIEDWKRFTKSEMFSETVPVNPHIAYKQDWRGYPKEFAYEKIKRKLTPEQIQDIVKTFGERWLDYKHFPDAIILDWFSTFDLFNVNDPFWKTLFKNFLEWRKDPQGIAFIRYCFSTGDLKQQFGKYSCIPKVRETRADYLDRTLTRLDDVKQLELLSEDKPIGVTGVMLNTKNVVPNKIADPKWYNMHVQFRNKQIWETLFDDDTFDKELALLKTYKKGDNEFRDDVLNKFWKEYNEVINFDYAKEYYRFKFPAKLIQLYGAYRMKWESGFFNMASTGDYKTGQAVISAVSSNAMNCLAIVPATIVDQWIRVIRSFYPHCQITSGKEIPESFFVNNGRFTTNFHVISYGLWQDKNTAKHLVEQFNGKAVIFQDVSKVLKSGKKKTKTIHRSIPKTVDFIILDEAHFVKQRFEDFEESDYNRKANRRIYIQELLHQERAKNRKMKALFLSATPSINNVQEAKSLLEMVTGVKYDSIKNYSNIRNAVKCYTEFLPVSLNHVKRYNIKTEGKDEPITVEGFLPDYYTDEQIKNLSYLDLDQIATAYRIPKIIELLKKCKGKSIIYSYYRTGVINQIQKALLQEINPETGNPYRIGFFTGEEKGGMVRRTGKKDKDGNEIIENPFILGEIDVLIATRAFGVGLDGVQEVCNNIFFNGFVFTYGDFEQITGRLIRSGQFSDTVNVYLIFAKLNGVAFDYELKYLRVKAKKSLGDCIKNGTLPKRISLGKQNKQRKRSLDRMLQNKMSGFPTKEAVESELEIEAMKHLDEQINTYFTEVEKLERMKHDKD